MKQGTNALLKQYKEEGWSVYKAPRTPFSSLPSNIQQNANGELPLIVTLPFKADYSPLALRRLLGLDLQHKIISIHSGVAHALGQDAAQFDCSLAKATAAELRMAGHVVCNGGYPSKHGLMRCVVEGALSAEESGKELPPIVMVVTENLFNLDNVHGRYPKRNIRVLLIEDSKYLPDSTLRANLLNNISDHILSLMGAWGTTAEIFLAIEAKDLNPRHYDGKNITLVNAQERFLRLRGYTDGVIGSGYGRPVPGVNWYTGTSEACALSMAKDLTEFVGHSFDGANRPMPLLTAGTIEAFGR